MSHFFSPTVIFNKYILTLQLYTTWVRVLRLHSNRRSWKVDSEPHIVHLVNLVTLKKLKRVGGTVNRCPRIYRFCASFSNFFLIIFPFFPPTFPSSSSSAFFRFSFPPAAGRRTEVIVTHSHRVELEKHKSQLSTEVIEIQGVHPPKSLAPPPTAQTSGPNSLIF